MSKFAKSLERVYRGVAPAIGFRRSAGADLPPLLLVVNLTGTNVREAKAIAACADAGIVSGRNLDSSHWGQMAAALGDSPLGLSLDGQDKADWSAVPGCDFVVFDLKAPVETVEKKEPGKILRVETSLEPGLVRAINELPLAVNGVLISGEQPRVTVEFLLVCQRFAGLMDRPLMVSLNAMVTGGELRSLYEAGVSCLVLPGALRAERLAELKSEIASLPRIIERKTRSSVLLPRPGGGPGVEVEEDEEEEDV